MQVKWHGLLSTKRHLPGSGAQGSYIGNWEYISQTNHNADCVPPDHRWKWCDDLSPLEIINLLTAGISSYNFKQHVASDIGTHGQYIPADFLRTQQYINTIDQWSDNQKMILSQKKTKIMLINFTKNYQFSTRLQLKNNNLEIVRETKILGMILTDDLKWDANCSYLIKKFYARMQLLLKVASFGTDEKELKLIYTTFCRGLLEQCCEVWSSSLTQDNKNDLERCQMSAMKIICKNYTSYSDSLRQLDLEDLETRRLKLLSRFQAKSMQHEKMKMFFKINENTHNTRNKEKYKVIKANTKRFQNSTIIQIQNIANTTSE